MIKSKNTTPKIFIVDDDPFVTAIIEKILADLDYRNIFSYTSGAECITFLGMQPDLIFLDYQMEGINGIEVLKLIKEKVPNAKVVFTTGLEDLEVAMESIALGAFDFLLKKNLHTKVVKKIMQKAFPQ